MSLSEDRITPLALNRLLPDPENVNVHNEINIAQIKASIARFGFLDPIGVVAHPSRRGYYTIVEGHGRHEAAVELDMKDVPCLILSLDEAARKGYAIAHNQIQQITAMDMTAVADEFRRLDVQAGDYLSLGFNEEDVLFMPGLREQDAGSAFAGGADLTEGAEGADPAGMSAIEPARTPDNNIDVTGKSLEKVTGFVPPVHRTSLRFASEVSYNRFVELLALSRSRYPLASTIGERLQLLLTSMGHPAPQEAVNG